MARAGASWIGARSYFTSEPALQGRGLLFFRASAHPQKHLKTPGFNQVTTLPEPFPTHTVLCVEFSPLVFSRLGLSPFGGSQTSYSQDFFVHLKFTDPTSLMVQWLRVHLPVQGMWVQALIGELQSHMLQGKPETHNWDPVQPNKNNKYFLKFLRSQRTFMWAILINIYHISNWNKF